jgi:hypothetical protein
MVAIGQEYIKLICLVRPVWSTVRGEQLRTKITRGDRVRLSLWYRPGIAVQ